MDATSIFAILEEKFPGDVTDLTVDGGVKDPFCVVPAGKLVQICKFLRDDQRLAFDFLQCITGVDYPREEQLCSVYHLYSYTHHHAIALKVFVPRNDPKVPSVTGVWSTADWQEREQYDLLGIQYTDHPELKRLLMPDDWVGYPMRKDYTEADSYREMSTTRYSVMELLAAYDKEHPQTEGQRPYVVEEDGE